jgi:riboflavin kinase/FMN adenylyltransferase
MEVFYGRTNPNFKTDRPSGLGLGNFDGLHLGHMKLINTLTGICKERNLTSWIYTFEEHPSVVLEPEPVPLIITNEQKIETAKVAGVENIFFDVFDREYADLSPKEFIHDILIAKFNAKLIVAGFNFFFGKDGKGNTELLKKEGQRHGFDVIIIPPVILNGEVVSSTAVRSLISNGNIPKANEMLGRTYSMTGIVTQGNRLGTHLGLPTANIIPDRKYLMPQRGVYVTDTYYKGKKYRSVTNIGIRPTVSDSNTVSIETHLIGYNEGFMYDHEIVIEFKYKIRDEMRFDGFDSLVAQIKNDIAFAINYKD